MANREQRGNREKRKPKANKPKPQKQASSSFPPAPGMAKGEAAGGKKSR